MQNRQSRYRSKTVKPAEKPGPSARNKLLSLRPRSMDFFKTKNTVGAETLPYSCRPVRAVANRVLTSSNAFFREWKMLEAYANSLCVNVIS